MGYTKLKLSILHTDKSSVSSNNVTVHCDLSYLPKRNDGYYNSRNQMRSDCRKMKNYYMCENS